MKENINWLERTKIINTTVARTEKVYLEYLGYHNGRKNNEKD